MWIEIAYTIKSIIKYYVLNYFLELGQRVPQHGPDARNGEIFEKLGNDAWLIPGHFVAFIHFLLLLEPPTQQKSRPIEFDYCGFFKWGARNQGIMAKRAKPQSGLLEPSHVIL